MKSINPDAYISAEIWSDTVATPRLTGDEFDAQMNYPFASAVIDWLAMRPNMSAADLAHRLDACFDNDAPQTRMVEQNLVDSHDTDRLVSDLYNVRLHPNRNFDQGNRPQQGEVYDQSKPDTLAYKQARLALILQATYIGAPMVYYGDEIGMYGADDPSNRRPFPWPDLAPPADSADAADMNLEQFYAKWLKRRRASDVLQLGSVIHLNVPDRPNDIFAFERRLNDQCMLIVINKGNQPVRLGDLCRDPSVADETVAPLDVFVGSIVP